MPFCVVFLWLLYHYERKWGTTTMSTFQQALNQLYHYERKWGTTTYQERRGTAQELYHYERK